MVLGEPPENLCVHLCLHHASPHHYRVLWADDFTPEERSHVVWLQREGQEPAENHKDGSCSGGGVYCLLDSYPHLCHH